MAFSPDQGYDPCFVRIIVLGGKNVGKTALVKRYVDNGFVDSYIQTMGIDFAMRQIKLDHHSRKSQVWEMSGYSMHASVEDVRSLVRKLATNTNADAGIMVVYNVKNKCSLETMVYYQDVLRQIRHDTNIPIMLVGNKCDGILDRNDKDVDDELVRKYKECLGCDIVIETSAKHGDNVEAAFVALIATAIENARKNSSENEIIKNKIPTHTGNGIRRGCYNGCYMQ